LRRIAHIFYGKTQIPLTHPDLKIPHRQKDIPTCLSAMAPGSVLAQASPCKKRLLFLPSLLSRFECERVAGKAPQLEVIFALRPKGGVWVTTKPA